MMDTSNMTPSQLVTIINEAVDAECERDDDFSWLEFEDRVEYNYGVEGLPSPLNTARYVDGYGGKDQGDAYWFVFSVQFEDGTTHLFRKNGYYTSHGGAELDGPTHLVEQKQVLVDRFVTIEDD